MRRLQKRIFLTVATAASTLLICGAALSQNYYGRRAWTIGNDKIKLVVTPGGGHIASMTLNSGVGANLNPLWLPPWKSVEPGQWQGGAYGDPPGAQLLSCILGHNLCLDFFGAPSPDEIKAGIPVHGEAPCINWTASSVRKNGITYGATLPLAQMKVTRSVKLTPGSSAVLISETVENLSAFDRPFGWQQHVTLGPPFLEVGQSRFDMNAGWSMVDPKQFSDKQRLKKGETFNWPDAPGANGETINLREYPTATKNSDFTTSLMDDKRQWVYFTCINPKKRLLIGYTWPRKVWPWSANWEENGARAGKPWNSKGLTRGIEFGTSPFAHPRREAVKMGKLENTPTYRWIGAKEKQSVTYIAFIAPIPAETTGVKDVLVTGKGVDIVLDGVDKTISLPITR